MEWIPDIVYTITVNSKDMRILGLFNQMDQIPSNAASSDELGAQGNRRETSSLFRQLLKECHSFLLS